MKLEIFLVNLPGVIIPVDTFSFDKKELFIAPSNQEDKKKLIELGFKQHYTYMRQITISLDLVRGVVHVVE